MKAVRPLFFVAALAASSFCHAANSPPCEDPPDPYDPGQTQTEAARQAHMQRWAEAVERFKVCDRERKMEERERPERDAAARRAERQEAERTRLVAEQAARDKLQKERDRVANSPLTRAEVDALLKRAEECIRLSDQEIAHQREIGAAVGFVDKQVMYQAGSLKVECRKRVAELNACRAAGRCARHSIPVSYALPPGDAP